MTAAVADRQHELPAPPFDLEAIRRDFPCLSQDVHGKPLVYLDSAASSQTPRQVVEAIDAHYAEDRANIHRGVHLLSQRATKKYEAVRGKVRTFLNGRDDREVVFLRGTTEALNLAASSLGELLLTPGDEILITGLEHHSNIVPWQLVAARTGAVLKVAPLNERGEVEFEAFERQLSDRTKVASFAHVSNALGTVNPVERMTAAAKAKGAVVVIDGAQAAPHMRVDVQAIGCDLYAFSGHKIFGPTGVGALWGRLELLERMPPWQGGGDMILTVSFEGSTWAPVPAKFEAGTPNIAGVIGMGAALDYLEEIGIDAASQWESELLAFATRVLADVPGFTPVGTAADKASVLSFTIEDIHPHDLGTILDRAGVAVRTGHHCAQPVMEHFGIPATARASFAFYNTPQEVLALRDGLLKCIEVLG